MRALWHYGTMPKRRLIFFFILFLAAFARFYKLGQVPFGLSQDETSLGYNAYSILMTGKDEHGQQYPLSFQAFGEYKLPGYIYLAVPFLALLGPTEIAIRLPSAIFGFLSVSLFYFLVKKTTRDETLSFVAMAFLALNPWHVHFSRAAFEVIPALFFLMLGAYWWLVFRAKGSAWYLGLSAFFLVVTLYTYNITKALAPLLFIGFLWLSRTQIQWKNPRFWLWLFPALGLAAPLIWGIFSAPDFHAISGTLLHSSARAQAELLELRSDVLWHSPLLAKVIFNQWVLTGYAYLKNIIGYLSIPFLFIYGGTNGNHDIDTVGMFYLFDIIGMVSGVIGLLRLKKLPEWAGMFALWLVLAVMVAAYTRESPHGARGIFIIPPLILLSAYGFQLLVRKLRTIGRKKFLTVGGVLLAFMFFELVHYFGAYYWRFPLVGFQSWRSADKQLVEFLAANQSEYDHIVFTPEINFMYTSLLYYLPYSPALFQEQIVRVPQDSEGFVWPQSFGKYRFASKETAQDGENTLFITDTTNTFPEDQIVGIIKHTARPIVVAEGQEIFQFPLEETAYVLIEKP